MPVKVVDVDIHNLDRIEGLSGYDAVEILFRAGREPLGRGRLLCSGDSIEPEEFLSLIENLPSPSPLDLPVETLPTVTIAICTRNRPVELAEALRSIARQEYPPDEILVIDNGCQEEIRELTEGIIPNARYVPEHSPGLNFARNRALSETTSEIIAFLDDDAEADPFWVRSIAECFAKFPMSGAVTGLTVPLELDTEAQQLCESNGGFGRGFSRRVLPHHRRRWLGFRLPLVADSIDVGNGCNMAFRNNVLKQLGGFDEALGAGTKLPGGDEMDMFYRVIRAGHELVYEPRALARHRHRRTKTELLEQLKGHQKGLTAFISKTLRGERGFTWIGVALFLAWRLARPGVRMIHRLVGRDALPLHFHARIFLACLAGLGNYQASTRRVQDLVRKSGGKPGRFTAQLSELWRYRELIWNLTARDLKVKYQRSWLGFLWTLLNPLVTVGVLVAIFSYVVHQRIFRL
jgi:GT2 family glycosyltransferase